MSISKLPSAQSRFALRPDMPLCVTCHCAPSPHAAAHVALRLPPLSALSCVFRNKSSTSSSPQGLPVLKVASQQKCFPAPIIIDGESVALVRRLSLAAHPTSCYKTSLFITPSAPSLTATHLVLRRRMARATSFPHAVCSLFMTGSSLASFFSKTNNPQRCK